MLEHTQKENRKALVIEDEEGSRSFFYPNLICIEDKKFLPWMKDPDFTFLCNGDDNSSISSLNFHSVPRIASAKKVLRDLNKRYTSLFIGQDYNLDEILAEERSFLNSNLLYFIAVTDRNEDTLYHSHMVARYTLMLSKALGIEDKEFLTSIERGALLHDIGKIGIPEGILRKPGPLTDTEKEIIKNHPFLGYEMIKEFDFLKKSAQVVLYHHEHYDGSGYPYGLAGEEIPIEARIFALADTFDALTSDRPYRKGKSFDEALVEMEKNCGSQFDPLLADIFISLPLDRLERIKEETYQYLSPRKVH
ncbi:MAG: HD domain-containing protein [Candidatus Aminicenantes bacterium]|nr:HD domain-containing protein [Candidatus Aminicenantes bacterium]